jgi:hypothetical protein
MNTTHNTKTKLFATAMGVAAAALMAPALLFAGAGTAQADLYDCYNQGYLDGIFGVPPQCFANFDTAQQGLYDLGVADAQGGLLPTLSRPSIQPSIQLPDPRLEPQDTMGPFTGAAPDPREFPNLWEDGHAPHPVDIWENDNGPIVDPID